MKEENKGFTDQQKAELDALAALPEDEIQRDDIPLRYWTGPMQERGVFYRPVKETDHFAAGCRHRRLVQDKGPRRPRISD